MADSLPAPAYVRYTGPGDAYDAKAKLGPYSVTFRFQGCIPSAVPADVADVLDPDEFERVDVVEAIEEIAAAETAKAAEEAKWRERHAAYQARKLELQPLGEIAAGRARALAGAARSATATGVSDQAVVEKALAAAGQFDTELAELAADGEG